MRLNADLSQPAFPLHVHGGGEEWSCRKLRRWSEKIFDLLASGNRGCELGKRAESGLPLAFADHVRDCDPFKRCQSGDD